ncbi:MAG: diguanylate cyclase [Candidatus Omnitrophica bacterium]|nr:diguanylate cyclase [Candidatus Omnitrophota bacterium]MCM8792951.1 diguanylate cyclase [Candidatus Omnitrophota bacterium]
MAKLKILNTLLILFCSSLLFFFIERLLWGEEANLEDKVTALFVLFIPLISLTIFTLGNIPGLFYFLFISLISNRFINYYQTTYITPLLGITFGVGVLSAFAENKFLLSIKEYKKNLLNLRERIDKYILEEEEKTRLQSLLTRRFERLFRLKFMAEELSITLDVNRVIKSAEQRIWEIIPSTENFLIYLVGDELGEMDNPRITHSLLKTRRGLQNQELELDIFDRWILRSYKNLLVNDVQKDFRFSPETVEDLKREFRALLACPLTSEGKILGVVRLESSLPGSFTPDDLRMLDIFSDLVTVGVENAYLYQKTEILAKIDGLTGLFLPRYLYTRIEEVMAKAKEFSLLMLDLDHFKDYNDRYGHIAGDIMLKKIAQLLLTHLSGEDFAVRYGGEEFLLVLVDKSKEKAIELAQKIRENVEKEIFYLRREATRLTISIGIAAYPREGRTKEELIHKADEWLYFAKEKGRNRIAYAGMK